MATVTVNYGTNTALTVTNLHSLGDGSYWQSASINNSTIKGLWVEVFITILTTTTAGTNGTVELYIANSTDGGTDFAGGASGSEGTYTDTANVDPDDLEYIGTMQVDATETTARTYKWRGSHHNVGEHFSFVIRNNCGAALGASTNAVEYRLNKYDSA